MQQHDQWFLDLIENAGGKLIFATPEEHDEMMVVVQAIRHFATLNLGVFLATENVNIQRSLDFSTPLYQQEISIISRLIAQSAPMVADIMLATQSRREAIARLADTTNRLAQLVTQGNRDALISELQKLQSFFAAAVGDSFYRPSTTHTPIKQVQLMKPKSDVPIEALRRILLMLRKYPVMVLGAIASLLMLTGSNILAPQLIRWGIDAGIAKNNLQVIVSCGGLIILVALIRGLFNFGQSFLAETVSQSIAYDLRNTFFSQTQYLSLSYHDRTPTSQLLTRINNDIEQIRVFIGATILQIFGAAIVLCSSVTILLLMNWKLTLIALVIIPISFTILGGFFRKNAYLFRNAQQQLEELNAVLKENLLGVRAVKAFVRQETEIKRYAVANEDFRTTSIKTIYALRDTFPIIFLTSNLIAVVIFGYGGLEVISRSFSIGELVAFNAYLVFIIQPIFQTTFAFQSVAQAAASAARVYEVIDAEIEVREAPDAIYLQKCAGKISFKNVDFRYPEVKENTLNNIYLEILPGQTVAILGMTGAGKSTIAKLIPRFYDATQGIVKVDDYDVRSLNLNSLRSHIGFISQEASLFSGTIRDNIAYGIPDAPLADVITAAKFAQIHDFILSLPDTYDTVIGERGLGLSGGQKQRITIARILLNDYKILIVDDSLSAVDAKTAALIQESFQILIQQRQHTIIFITQRINNIVKSADQIFVIDQGKLVALKPSEI
ncbi:ABC transporter transmembrane domain-containing protein [Fortiea contorta]|uniref:ABC transporter transmembrane domain-containing protein n=1 Tax=Fortiea contorta TaxID=1892405 RepID=UPI00035DF15D|nr:ABC transporter transmembrane domain-containing protein [Fortiea contorta]